MSVREKKVERERVNVREKKVDREEEREGERE